MKLTQKMLALMRDSNVSPIWLARKLNLTYEELLHAVNGKVELELEQAKILLAMFGAEELARVIDWEGMNVRCPI